MRHISKRIFAGITAGAFTLSGGTFLLANDPFGGAPPAPPGGAAAEVDAQDMDEFEGRVVSLVDYVAGEEAGDVEAFPGLPPQGRGQGPPPGVAQQPPRPAPGVGGPVAQGPFALVTEDDEVYILAESPAARRGAPGRPPGGQPPAGRGGGAPQPPGQQRGQQPDVFPQQGFDDQLGQQDQQRRQQQRRQQQPGNEAGGFPPGRGDAQQQRRGQVEEQQRRQQIEQELRRRQQQQQQQFRQRGAGRGAGQLAALVGSEVAVRGQSHERAGIQLIIVHAVQPAQHDVELQPGQQRGQQPGQRPNQPEQDFDFDDDDIITPEDREALEDEDVDTFNF